MLKRIIKNMDLLETPGLFAIKPFLVKQERGESDKIK